MRPTYNQRRFLVFFSIFSICMLLQSCGSGCNSMSRANLLTDEEKIELENFKRATPDHPTRQLWQKPQLVIDKMGDLSDKTVADIGAGTGYFSFRIARHAEKVRKVIAIDIAAESLQHIENEKQQDETIRPRIETRLATPTNPKLMKQEVDVILMVNTYIYLDNRVAYLRNLRQTLKPNGRIFIVDYKKRNLQTDASTIPPIKLRLGTHEVESDLIEAGFVDIHSDDQSLEYQYITQASVN